MSDSGQVAEEGNATRSEDIGSQALVALDVKQGAADKRTRDCCTILWQRA